MKLKAMVMADTYKPAGKWTDDRGHERDSQEKRVLTVVEMPGSDGHDVLKHVLEIRIPVNDTVAGPKESLRAGTIVDVQITEVRPGNREQEIGVVGSVVSIAGQAVEKAYSVAGAKQQ